MTHVAPSDDAMAQVDAIVTAKWSLPIIRVLLEGPARFSRLKALLAGVSSKMLTARLRDLEGRGIIQRATLPPPADCEAYELTAKGFAAEPLVLAIARWSQLFEAIGD